MLVGDSANMYEPEVSDDLATIVPDLRRLVVVTGPTTLPRGPSRGAFRTLRQAAAPR